MIELDCLMRRSENEPVETDCIRDEMDALWLTLPDEEQKAIRDLSIELYAEWVKEETIRVLTHS